MLSNYKKVNSNFDDCHPSEHFVSERMIRWYIIYLENHL